MIVLGFKRSPRKLLRGFDVGLVEWIDADGACCNGSGELPAEEFSSDGSTVIEFDFVSRVDVKRGGLRGFFAGEGDAYELAVVPVRFGGVT